MNKLIRHCAWLLAISATGLLFVHADAAPKRGKPKRPSATAAQEEAAQDDALTERAATLRKEHPTGLLIVQAKYGVDNRWKDVTAELQAVVWKDSITVKVGDESFGDPSPGQGGDTLVITTDDGSGGLKTQTLSGGETLQIGPMVVATIARDGHLTNLQARLDERMKTAPAGLIVLDAQFGVQGRWKDVTEILQKKSRGTGLAMYIGDETLGNPAPGQAFKELEIWYWDGQSIQFKKVPEGHTMALGTAKESDAALPDNLKRERGPKSRVARASSARNMPERQRSDAHPAGKPKPTVDKEKLIDGIVATKPITMEDRVVSIAVAGDVRNAFVVDSMGRMAVCNLTTGTQRPLPPPGGGAATAAVLSPRGKMIAVATFSSGIFILDADKGPKGVLSDSADGHWDGIGWSPDAKQLVALGQTKLRTWDVDGNKRVLDLDVGQQPLKGVRTPAVSPESATVVVAGLTPEGRYNFARYDGKQSRWEDALDFRIEDTPAFALFVDKNHFLFPRTDRELALVKYEGGEVQLPFQIGNQDEASAFSAGALSADGARIAAGAGRAIYVWDAKTARLLKKFDWSGERIESLCFTHDNQMLVTAAGKTIQAWGVSSASDK